MLSLFGKPRQGYCDGQSRRDFLRVGTLAFGGISLSMADVLRCEAAELQAGRGGRSKKSVIHVFLGGGPPHQDMWDIKEDAPAEIRGEFSSIETAVPGIRICQEFPLIAQVMDKCTVIRSIDRCVDQHDAYMCNSGWKRQDLVSVGGRPSFGSVAANLLGATKQGVPPFVGLAAKTREIRWSDSGHHGFLSKAYQAFKLDGPGMSDLTLNGVSSERLDNRGALLKSISDAQSALASVGSELDAFQQEAFDVLLSNNLARAFDVSHESPEVRARYGDGKPYEYQFDGAPTVNDHLLVARRLVEAGARVVSLSFGRWDSHSQNFDLVRDHGRKLDQCLSALIEDLHERGMLDDVLVLVWGEFGRTPRINNKAGRDHWPQVSCALLAGGGYRMGQAIGATNRLGEFPTERPVPMQEVLATVYHHLGIDVANVKLQDPAGRPQYLLDHHEPMPELV
jgi:hypothetical protein